MKTPFKEVVYVNLIIFGRPFWDFFVQKEEVLEE